MANIVLQFGKYKGFDFEHIVAREYEGSRYVRWLAGASIARQNASREAADFLSNGRKQAMEPIGPLYSREELEEREEQEKRDAEEMEEVLRSLQIGWETESGHQMKISSQIDDGLRPFFWVSVDGNRRRYDPCDLKECKVLGKPEIIGRIGPVGLTADRYSALLEMLNPK